MGVPDQSRRFGRIGANVAGRGSCEPAKANALDSVIGGRRAEWCPNEKLDL